MIGTPSPRCQRGVRLEQDSECWDEGLFSQLSVRNCVTRVNDSFFCGVWTSVGRGMRRSWNLVRRSRDRLRLKVASRRCLRNSLSLFVAILRSLELQNCKEMHEASGDSNFFRLRLGDPALIIPTIEHGSTDAERWCRRHPGFSQRGSEVRPNSKEEHSVSKRLTK